MKFRHEQQFECNFPTGARRAQVEELFDGGHKATLRFLDGERGTFTHTWAELVISGNWRPV